MIRSACGAKLARSGASRAAAAKTGRRHFSADGAPLSRITTKRTLDGATASQQLQILDRRRYLCGLMLPRQSRDAFCAIQVFQHTLDSTWRDPGALQWWRECTNTAYTSGPQYSSNVHGRRLADGTDESGGKFREQLKHELYEARMKHGLKRRWFERAIDSYQGLSRGQVQSVTLSDVERYVLLFYLCVNLTSDVASLPLCTSEPTTAVVLIARSCHLFRSRGTYKYCCCGAIVPQVRCVLPSAFATHDTE
jgi:hypothetical protein